VDKYAGISGMRALLFIDATNCIGFSETFDTLLGKNDCHVGLSEGG
jgi:hypothetical protein